MIVYVTNFFHPQIVTWRQISPPPYSAYQILILPNPKLRFHFLNQRLKLYLALFLAIGVNVPSDTLTVNCWSVSPFPHVFAFLDKNDRCHQLSTLSASDCAVRVGIQPVDCLIATTDAVRRRGQIDRPHHALM